MTIAPEAHPRTPDRPGPGPLPETLLRALDLTIGRRIEGMLAGDHRSSVLGQGSELAQVRPYVPGDDVRRIEWNVTARTGETHVRVDLAERVLVTWLALDASASMAFGTAERRKADVAEGVSIAVGHVAARRGNRLGVVAFGGPEPRVLRPRQGRLGLLGLLAELRAEPPADGSGATSLGDASRRMAALARARGLVADIDFDAPFQASIEAFARLSVPLEEARSRLSYGERLRRDRRRVDARAQLRAAASTFERLGARLWAERTRAELRATGATIEPHRTGASLDALTPQELQVALIVADGISNKATAARLFLSIKTVEAHLHRTYRKLGISSRNELARLVTARSRESSSQRIGADA